MSGEDLDRKLTRMLAAVGAGAEPALLTRARARIEARAREPLFLRWAMRPAALGASVALFVASVGISLTLVSTAPEAGESSSLVESLLAERGIEDGSAPSAPALDTGSAPDSGDAR